MVIYNSYGDKMGKNTDFYSIHDLTDISRKNKRASLSGSSSNMISYGVDKAPSDHIIAKNFINQMDNDVNQGGSSEPPCPARNPVEEISSGSPTRLFNLVHPEQLTTTPRVTSNEDVAHTSETFRGKLIFKLQNSHINKRIVGAPDAAPPGGCPPAGTSKTFADKLILSDYLSVITEQQGYITKRRLCLSDNLRFSSELRSQNKKSFWIRAFLLFGQQVAFSLKCLGKSHLKRASLSNSSSNMTSLGEDKAPSDHIVDDTLKRAPLSDSSSSMTGRGVDRAPSGHAVYHCMMIIATTPDAAFPEGKPPAQTSKTFRGKKNIWATASDVPSHVQKLIEKSYSVRPETFRSNDILKISKEKVKTPSGVGIYVDTGMNSFLRNKEESYLFNRLA